MDRDGFIHAALYDASAPGAGQRLGLLDYLAAQGIRIDDTVAAHHEGRLTVAAAEQRLGGGRERLMLTQVYQRAGVDRARSAHTAG